MAKVEIRCIAKDCQLQPYRCAAMNPIASSWLTSRELRFAFPHSLRQTRHAMYSFFVCLFALPSKEENQKNKEKCVKWNYLSHES